MLRHRSLGHRSSSLATHFSKAQARFWTVSHSKLLFSIVSGVSLRSQQSTRTVVLTVVPDVRRRFDVVNRGLSGYNTSQALKALPQIFSPPTEGGPQIKYLVSATQVCHLWISGH